MKHYVGVQLRTRLRGFSEALEAAQRNPADPEHLHDIRVASRRLSQALRLFRDFLKKKHVKRIRRRIHELVQACGSVRDCDITLGTLEAAQVQDSDLRVKLQDRRTHCLADLQQHLQAWRGEPDRWRDHLDPRSPKGATWIDEQTAASNAARVLPSMAVELFAAGATAVASGESRQLHRFRLLGKRFRYSVEIFTDVYGPRVERCLAEMRTLQDVLGAINDCAASIPFAEGHPDAQQKLQTLLAHRRTKFLEFWERFAALQPAWIRALGG